MAFSRKNQIKKALKHLKYRNEVFKTEGIVNTDEAIHVRNRIEKLKKKVQDNG